MIWLLYVLISLFFLLLLLIFSKLTVHIDYYHHNDNDDLKIEFRIWFGLIKYKLKVPLVKIDDNSPSIVVERNTQMGNSSEDKEVQITPDSMMGKYKNMKQILQHVIDMNVIVKKFLLKISIKQFEWHSLIGVGDAAHTGVLSGALWTIKGSIVGMLSHYLKMRVMPALSVTPYFQFTVIQTRITCIIQFRIGHAILAGLKLIKFWKGGLPNLKMKAAYSREKTKSV